MPPDAQTREARHQLIRQLLERRRITTQAELLDLLVERGHEVTQSSVSRDLQELGVAKVDGVYRLPPPAVASADPVERTVFALVVGRVPAGDHLLVVRTPAGAAAIVAAAIDALELPEIAGTLAGDDTLFVATASRAHQQRVIQALDALAEGAHP